MADTSTGPFAFSFDPTAALDQQWAMRNAQGRAVQNANAPVSPQVQSFYTPVNAGGQQQQASQNSLIQQPANGAPDPGSSPGGNMAPQQSLTALGQNMQQPNLMGQLAPLNSMGQSANMMNQTFAPGFAGNYQMGF